MDTIKFKLLHPNAKLPVPANEHAAAYDVVAVSREIKDGYVSYGLGFSTEIPTGWQAKCYPRSSVSNVDLVLCNSVGIIDADYRGEWSYRFKVCPPVLSTVRFREERQYATIGCANINIYKMYEVGERIGQIQFERVPELRFEVVESLSATERGAGGFGSTGQ